MKCKLVNKAIYNNYIPELLEERGLTKEEVQYLLNVEDDRYLESPQKLDYIKEGMVLLHEYLANDDNTILIVVDSDVDGFTSAAMMYKYIDHRNPNIKVDYLLHKGKGHGLADTIQDILSSDTHYDLVILPDSSSNDYEYHLMLKNYGAECLILDHHLVEPDTKFADNAVIINNQLSDGYTNKNLCGAGVVWQFIRYMDSFCKEDYASTIIDLAALGIVSDMMSMLSLENRYIVKNGFENVSNYFFQALCDKQSYSMGGKVTPMTVAFYITPLINAMIRVGSMEEKQRCFEAFLNGHKMIPSKKRGAKGAPEELAIESARECTNARAKQNRILDKAVELLEIKIFKYDLLENKILFIELEDEDIPAELNGLVAMKLSQKYKKPTIIARVNEQGEVKGSQRGLNESELKDFKGFLDSSGLMLFTAGHANASGIGIKEENIDKLLDYANTELADVDFGENWYEVNFERLATDSDLKDLIWDISSYEDIWGQLNAEPLIHVKDINVTKKDVQIMGRNKDTIKIEKNGVAYMFFRCKDHVEEFKAQDELRLEVVGRANLNEWGGMFTPQIFVTDFEIKKGLPDYLTF